MPARGQQHGFTLIEVLVVALIIGVVLAFVSLSINPTGPADRLDTEADRLNALLQTAADDAILYGRELGLDITRGGYRFLRLGDDGWQPLNAPDTPLRPRELGDAIVLVLVDRGDDRPRLVRAEDDEDEEDLVRPEAVLLSSGEFVPFELELYANDVDYRYRITGEAGGTLEMIRVDGPR
ncbi:type II secretion system minor pseudopilin GspH [Salinisphaera sp.]|uniref:type II secretion system minor pseudopilin GspH n=1 Tax=Salinisphaera sp. TaxID=1914330 RepID=UPI000C4E6173|nr:type II secretion system minor pseudopilin GspH [Salinisphaera sp.]MBS63489.1 type II secretion system protein GspH [Salinisphaera sp.]